MRQSEPPPAFFTCFVKSSGSSHLSNRKKVGRKQAVTPSGMQLLQMPTLGTVDGGAVATLLRHAAIGSTGPPDSSSGTLAQQSFQSEVNLGRK